MFFGNLFSQNECYKWTETAQLLVSQVVQQPVIELFPNFPQSRIYTMKKGDKEANTEEQPVQTEPEPELPIPNTGQEKQVR